MASFRPGDDLELVRELYDNAATHMPSYLAETKRDASNCGTLINLARQGIAAGCIVEPGSPELPRMLRIAGMTGSAMFQAATWNDDTPLDLGDGDPVRFTASPPGSLVHAGAWLHAFYCNILSKEYGQVGELCNIPPEVLRTSSTTVSEYVHLFAEALRALIRGDADTPDKLLTALEATDPERDDVVDGDWALHFDVPQNEVLFCAITGDDAGFNEALAKGVKLHEAYWSASDRRSRNFKGFISLELTALAAFGQRRGRTLSITSRYLPMQLAAV